MKIKFKPIVFDAIKFHGMTINQNEYESFLKGCRQQILRHGMNLLIIMPHGGKAQVKPGDWIAQHSDGTIYAITKEEFVDVFEECTEPKMSEQKETINKDEYKFNQGAT